MKNINIIVSVLALLLSTNAFCQKDKVVIASFEYAQSRVLEPQINSHITPLIADIKILEEKGRIKDTWTFPSEPLVNTLTARRANASVDPVAEYKAQALFLSAQKHGADVIVAATFYISLNPKTDMIELTLVGFPGIYTNWRNIEEKDIDWIALEHGITNSVAKIEDESK